MTRYVPAVLPIQPNYEPSDIKMFEKNQIFEDRYLFG